MADDHNSRKDQPQPKEQPLKKINEPGTGKNGDREAKTETTKK